MSDEIAVAEQAVVRSGLDLIRLSPATAEVTFNRMIRAAWASTDADEGGDRFLAATRRDETFDRLAALVCARHAVTRDAIQRNHQAKGKPHVVAARMHLAHEMRKTGLFSWRQIGLKLGVRPDVAKYYDERHRERMTGADGPVTDEQALAAGEIVRAGRTWRQAAEQLGVSWARLRHRVSWMKEQGKWPK